MNRNNDTFVKLSLIGIFAIALVTSFSKPATVFYRSLVAVATTLPDFPWHDYETMKSEIEDTNKASLPVLIEFNENPGPAEISIIKDYGGMVSRTFHLVPAIAAEVPAENILKLFKHPGVKTIELDHYGFRKSDTPTTSEVQKSEINFSSTTNVTRENFAHFTPKRQVAIAVLDSGVDYNHPDIKPWYAGGYNFVNNSDDPMDDYGHGTHVTGIIVHVLQKLTEDNIQKPDVKMYSLKVLDNRGAAYFSNIVAALEWAVDHKIDITNNSYSTLEDPGDIVQHAYANAEKAGMIIVGAAGNAGVCEPNKDNVEYPARYSSVIAVGALDKDYTRPCFSTTGPHLDLMAPGVSIVSSQVSGGYITHTGTSMATPNVSAIAALIMSADIHDSNNNNRVNDEVRNILEISALDLGAPGRDKEYGFGMVNAKQALLYISSPNFKNN
jgi:subtilisin